VAAVPSQLYQRSSVRNSPIVRASVLPMSDEFVIFARFHAMEGNADALAAELAAAAVRTRSEPCCRLIEIDRSVRDGRLFFINSR
jgi:hypothetical protein